jgi:hypothetical protein
MMKLLFFNGLLLGLALVGLVGWLLTWNKLFLALLVIFGVWFVINVGEHFVRKHFENKPIKMVKE